jgi:hypothetical protein
VCGCLQHDAFKYPVTEGKKKKKKGGGDAQAADLPIINPKLLAKARALVRPLPTHQPIHHCHLDNYQ